MRSGGHIQHIKRVRLQNIPRAMNIGQLEYQLVTKPNDWLEVAYDVLRHSFDETTLDPLDRYVEWLQLMSRGEHPFPFLLIVAYIRYGVQANVVGVISGNIMKIVQYDGSDEQSGNDWYIYAIGHQVTEPAAKQIPMRGIGTRLSTVAVETASQWIKDRKGKFLCSVLEAEPDSIGFWTKVGYRWPEAVRYWQPPLQFHPDGQYIFPEVPTILLLKPIEAQNHDAIRTVQLKNIIATIFLNWSLHKYRKVLSSNAMHRAETYVMGQLYKRIVNTIPEGEHLNLVTITPGANAIEHITLKDIAIDSNEQ
jgi:hypothetical protein